MESRGGTDRSSDAEGKSPRVLIVEERAHEPAGHLPGSFAELARAFGRCGYLVSVLTARGWLHEDEQTHDFSIYRYSSKELFAQRLSWWLQTRCRWSSVLKRLGRATEMAIPIVSARRLARRLEDPVDFTVVMAEIDPVLASILAGKGRWLLYVYTMLDPVEPAIASRLFCNLSKIAECRRRSTGGSVRVAVSAQQDQQQLATRAAFLDPVVLPIAGARPVHRVADARAQLGLREGARIALSFGYPGGKESTAVLKAFEDLPDWHLVIGGQLADQLDASSHERSGGLSLFPGFVSPAVKDLLYSAADLAVCSLRAGYRRNSGTVTEALAFGLPIVCSEPSEAGSLVAHYHLGATFKAGDPDALREAVKQAPLRLSPEVTARAQEEMSTDNVARGFTALFAHGSTG